LIESGLDYIKVAIDGISNETNSLYRVGADVSKVMENFELLMRRKKELKSEVPVVEWQFVVFKHNEHEVEEAKRIAKRLGVDYFHALPAYTEDADWIPEREEYKTKLYDPESIKKCKRLWSHINVRCDGGIAACCYEFFKKDDFGNIFEEPFDEIWNNEITRYSRELCVNPKLLNEERKMDTICYNCVKYEKKPTLNIEDIEKQERLINERKER
jgi:MoaA/NifB/PqqE/SkfB family radical SAM enzyme